MSCRFVCSLVSSFFNADCVRVLVYAFTSMSLFCCYCHCGCYCGNSCVVVVCSRCLLLHCVYCWRRVTHLMKFLLLTASPPTSTIATIIIIAGQRSFQDCVNCVWRYTVDQRVCAFALFVRPSVPCLLVDSILVYFFSPSSSNYMYSYMNSFLSCIVCCCFGGYVACICFSHCTATQ